MIEKRILHVVNISFVIPYFLGEQLNWFSEKGYKEYVVCSPSEELPVFASKYNFVYKEVEILRKVSVLKDLKAVFKTMKYIRQIRADIVTGHTIKGGLIGMMAAWLSRVPNRIYFRHGLLYETSNGFKRIVLINIERVISLLSTQIVCVSPSVAKKSLDVKLNPRNKQVVLAHGSCNGVDINRFCRDRIDNTQQSQLKKSLGINENEFVIGFTGRLVRDKGIIDLINAYRILRANNDSIRLLLVGMFEVRDALPKEVIDYIKEEKSIIFTGYIDNSIIELYYSLMDVFVFPSYREGFGVSVIEASAMELPVISTRVTGCIDSVKEGVSGVFTEHDPQQIAEQIQMFYDNPEMKKKMGNAGRNYVIESFCQELVWKEIEKLYV